MEQSRLEAERGAKELQALSSKPIVPTPLLVLGKQKLFVSDKHGNFHVPASRASHEFPFDPFLSRKEIGKKDKRIVLSDTLDPRLIVNISDARKENPSSDAPPHSFPPAPLPESNNDSKVNEELGLERSEKPLVPESKDTVADSVGVTSECLPQVRTILTLKLRE